jgi:hypothetical protein
VQTFLERPDAFSKAGEFGLLLRGFAGQLIDLRCRFLKQGIPVRRFRLGGAKPGFKICGPCRKLGDRRVALVEVELNFLCVKFQLRDSGVALGELLFRFGQSGLRF